MKWKAFVTPLVTLVLGFALGISYHRLAAPKPFGDDFNEANHQRIMVRKMEFFNKELKLNKDQQEKVQEIFKDSREKLKELRDRVHPEFKNLRRESQQKIRELLTPEQQQTFDKMQDKRRERFKDKFPKARRNNRPEHLHDREPRDRMPIDREPSNEAEQPRNF
jgi:Spy/CpxP family protein refolding chaperone